MLLSRPLAYIDPMSGAILLQLILAGVVGAVAFFRRSLWAAVRTVFRLKRPKQEPPGDSSEPHAP